MEMKINEKKNQSKLSEEKLVKLLEKLLSVFSRVRNFQA